MKLTRYFLVGFLTLSNCHDCTTTRIEKPYVDDGIIEPNTQFEHITIGDIPGLNTMIMDYIRTRRTNRNYKYPNEETKEAIEGLTEKQRRALTRHR